MGKGVSFILALKFVLEFLMRGIIISCSECRIGETIASLNAHSCFSLSVRIKCLTFSMPVNFMPKSSELRVSVRFVMTCFHSPGVCLTGTFPHGSRCCFRSSHTTFLAYFSPCVPFLTSANSFPFFN